MAGQRILDPLIGVRIPASEPILTKIGPFRPKLCPKRGLRRRLSWRLPARSTAPALQGGGMSSHSSRASSKGDGLAGPGGTALDEQGPVETIELALAREIEARRASATTGTVRGRERIAAGLKRRGCAPPNAWSMPERLAAYHAWWYKTSVDILTCMRIVPPWSVALLAGSSVPVTPGSLGPCSLG